MEPSRRALCLVAEGFEEIEMVTPVDILRRAGVGVVIATAGTALEVTGRSGIRLLADEILDKQDPTDFDVLLLPGGPAVAVLRKDGRAAALARKFYDTGKLVAAICAAPLILHDAGLLHGVPHTSHATTQSELSASKHDERLVEHDRILTSRGAGTALDFALALARKLTGPATADSIARAIMA